MAEFGFFVSAGTDKGIEGNKIVGSGTVYNAVLQGGSDLWRPADGYAIALLDIKGVTQDYIVEENSNIYVTAYVKTANGDVYYGAVATINLAKSGQVEQIGSND